MKKKAKKPRRAKKKINREALRNAIIQHLASKNYLPKTEEELFQALQLENSFQIAAKEILTRLLMEGAIEIKKNKLFLKGEERQFLSGVLRMHPRGFGFVIPDQAALHPQDVFIPKPYTNGAVDGDRVEVEIFDNPRSEKGPEGRVSSVIERGREHVAGIIQSSLPKGRFAAYVPILGSSKNVMVSPIEDPPLKEGDRIILKIEDWGSKEKPVIASFSHYLGHISDPSIDVKAAAEEFDLRNTFPIDVVQEAKKFGNEVSAEEIQRRVDFRDTVCVTIDPTTAKDYDDALHVSKDKNGTFLLHVHIADVAHYVTQDSALDKEARLRCNSTYFPGKCIPMLPEELSNELCSLKPDVPRLTVSVVMKIDKNGNLIAHEIVRSVIQSRKRFTYEEAKEVLDKKKKSPYRLMLAKMVELCDLLKAKRRERGSIDFSMPELLVEVDEKGMPTGTKTIEYDITHQMVEEFMLKANEVVALELSSRGKELLYRIHEEPTAENAQDFYQLARSLGFAISMNPTQQEVQKLFEEIKTSPFAQQLTVAFIRSMRLAYYSSENVGHFGLALTHYTHFTSPIRRYSDLIIQRLLFGAEIPIQELKKTALDCSEQERISFKAESSVKLLKKLRLLSSWEEKEKRTYKAYVTKIKPFGFFFDLSDLSLEGFLHVSELEDDFFDYNEKQNKLIGRYEGITYAPSTEIQVEVDAIDFIYQEVRWRLRPSFFSKKKKRK